MLPVMKKYMPGDELLVRHMSTQNIPVGHELLCKTQDIFCSDKFLHHRDERHTCCLRNMHEEYKWKGTHFVSGLSYESSLAFATTGISLLVRLDCQLRAVRRDRTG